MDKYCDTSKVTIEKTTKDIVYDMVVNKHYAGRWTGSKHIYAIYYDMGEHSFFDAKEKKLIGCIIYGYPVGRRTSSSIFEGIEYEDKDVMELKRLWIEDGYGNNIESYTISKSIKLLKEDEDRAKIIISYSDPAENHKGIIYRASNFYYQGNDIGHSPNYMFKLPNEDKWITARTLTDRIDGSVGIEKVKKKIPDIEIKVAEKKHRYLYFLCNRGEKKRLIKQLKHPLVSYA